MNYRDCAPLCFIRNPVVNKVAVTPANITDAKGMKHICPDGGTVYADKAYCTNHAEHVATKKSGTLRAVKKNNMKGKDRKTAILVVSAPHMKAFLHIKTNMLDIKA